MEQTLFSKLNLYDQIGYFLVGSVLIILISLDLFFLNSFKLMPAINSVNLIFYLVTAYFFGHIVQALANIIIKEKKYSFDSFESKILKEAEKFFNVGSIKPSQSDVFQLCYLYALGKDKTSHLVQFNSLYSFYRGTFLVFFLESIFLLFLLIFNWFNIFYLCAFLLSVAVFVLMFLRLKRFAIYFRKKVFYIFLLSKASES